MLAVTWKGPVDEGSRRESGKILVRLAHVHNATLQQLKRKHKRSCCNAAQHKCVSTAAADCRVSNNTHRMKATPPPPAAAAATAATAAAGAAAAACLTHQHAPCVHEQHFLSLPLLRCNTRLSLQLRHRAHQQPQLKSNNNSSSSSSSMHHSPAVPLCARTAPFCPATAPVQHTSVFTAAAPCPSTATGQQQ
jgi:hypothetical protein